MIHRLFIILILMFSTTAHAEEALSLGNVEAHLRAQEARFDDLVEGTEKHIRWFAEAQQQTDVAIVYLHGFSASRQELSPLVERLADRIQANVFYTRLQGHGRSDDAMAEGTVAGWQQDTLEAYRIGQLLGKEVIVIGTSTGATLATWLNTQEIANNMAANILISPNYGVQNSSASMMKWRLGLWLAKLINGDYHSFTPMNEFHGRYWTERYPLDAIVPMLELVDEVSGLNKASIQTPQLMIYSPTDKVIEIEEIKRTATSMSSARVAEIPFTISKDPYQHVLVGKASSVDEVDEMLTIIKTFLKTHAPITD